MMERFQAYVEANRDRFIEELAALCAQPSIAAQGIGLEETAAMVEGRLSRLGARVQRYVVDGGAPILCAEIGQGRRTLLVYNHYDVQPADPLGEWESPPFELTLRDGRMYARGVADDKGDLMCRLQAVEAYQASVGPLPLRIKFLIEGEEEIGSPHLAAFSERYPALIEADGCLWETGGKDAAGRFLLELGVKGLCYLELTVRTARSDLHSMWGTVVPDAAWRLTWALNTLKDASERILVDGFMDRVLPPTEAELAHLATIPFDEEQIKKDFGIGGFVLGLTGVNLLAKHFYGPTCTISGVRSGYTEQGVKTVLPCAAMAKVSFRLVPDLTPELVLELVREHLAQRGLADVEVRLLGGMMPARSPMDAPFVQACAEAARAVYGAEPVVYPTSPGSGPLYQVCRRTPAVTAGVSHANCRIHAPNENVFLKDYLQGIRFVGEMIQRFAL
jgi:acetylornithine deacetylase/succinyl-diaminopimelate desuccinylase-like protein